MKYSALTIDQTIDLLAIAGRRILKQLKSRDNVLLLRENEVISLDIDNEIGIIGFDTNKKLVMVGKLRREGDDYYKGSFVSPNTFSDEILCEHFIPNLYELIAYIENALC